jgi:preprotein translocase subunit SecE
MERIKQWVARVRAFLGEVNVELRKCAWPTRPELVESTIVVILSVLLLAVYVGLSDGVVIFGLRMLLR